MSPLAGPEAVRDQLRRLAVTDALVLPPPGGGDTPRRWRALYELGRDEDVSVARLAEAHVDAVAILAEAGLEPVGDACYGVWASVGPGHRDVELASDGTLTGTKPFCSGVGIVDRALIEVHEGNERRLIDVDVSAASSWESSGVWTSSALLATATAAVEFARHPAGDRSVGPPGWYLSRPGFWHGAVGPAACWAGAAAGLVASVWTERIDDHHRGALEAECWTMQAVLHRAGEVADDEPDDAAAARRVALATRSAVHDAALRIVDRCARTFGPRAMVGDAQTSQRFADTQLYLRQFHGDDDLRALAATTDELVEQDGRIDRG